MGKARRKRARNSALDSEPPDQQRLKVRLHRWGAGLVGFGFGVLGTILAQRIIEAADRPRIGVAHSLVLREVFTEEVAGARVITARTLDLINECTATRVSWRPAPWWLRAAGPPERLLLKIILTNSGRTAATDVRLVLSFSPQLRGLELED